MLARPASQANVHRTPARRRAQPGLPGRQGFTLIELLVVVLIIGIVLTFVSLSINTNSAAERLERAAQRLEALAQAAATDAVLHGTEIGLDITPEGYRFVKLTPDGWQVLDGNQPLRPRKLGPGLELVAVTVEDEQYPGLVKRGGEKNHDDGDVRRRPEALFLSSGALIPFALELHARDVDHAYRLIGHPDGRIELKKVGGSS